MHKIGFGSIRLKKKTMRKRDMRQIININDEKYYNYRQFKSIK